MEVIVTDVTYMKGGNVCVATWCPELGKMIRPLSAPHKNWSVADAHSDLFAMGNALKLSPSNIDPDSIYPHKTEDMVVSKLPHKVNEFSGNALAIQLLPSISLSVDAIFGGNLENNRLINAGTQCSSLGAIITNSKRLGFMESKEGKLRCWFYAGDNDNEENFNLPVSSKLLKDTWQSSGLGAVNNIRGICRTAHIRLGLSRKMSDGNECYLMVNNILFY